MKVIVFGGSGFLGSVLMEELKNSGLEAFSVSRDPEKAHYCVDLSSFDSFTDLPSNYFDAVVNCATILPGGNYLDSDYLQDIFKTNILGSQNICKWIANQKSVTSIINCSTLVTVAKPWPIPLTEDAITYPVGHHVLYSSSKLFQELVFDTFASKNQIKLLQIRFSALYGKNMPWSGLICNLIDQAKINKKIAVTNAAKVSIDFLYVKDAASIIVAALKSEKNGIVNGASGTSTTILQLAELIKKLVNPSIQIEDQINLEFKEDLSVISVSKLESIINPNSFLSLENGIKKMLL